MIDTIEQSDSRRDFLRKAAIGGAAAVWAPPIVESVTSGAAAGTPGATAGCFKVQYNWATPTNGSNLMVALNNTDLNKAGDNTTPCTWVMPAGLCTPCSVADRYKSNDIGANKNCCHLSTEDSCDGTEDPDWWDNSPPQSVCDFTQAATCITVTSSVSGCTTPEEGLSDGDWIQFEMNHGLCPDCYMADMTIAYTSDKDFSGVSTTTAPATSDFYRVIRLNFTSSSPVYPIYFKFWVGCGLFWDDTSGGSLTPFTQCDNLELSSTSVT